jgi:hypothetical protein
VLGAIRNFTGNVAGPNLKLDWENEVHSFEERVAAHGTGGPQNVCPVNCGKCCMEHDGTCRFLGEDGCTLSVEERPAACNLYLCPDQAPSPKRGPCASAPPFDPPPHRLEMRAAMLRWSEHRVRDVPAGCPPGSTFGSAYLTNLRDHGERSVWDKWSPTPKRVLVVGGGPMAKVENLISETMHFLPNTILITRDHLRLWWDEEDEFNTDWWSESVYVVDGELDMLGCARDYPADYNRGLIIDPCKLLDPRIPFGDVRFVRCRPMQREDEFYKPRWLGREVPYRTSGELALYVALYVLCAPVVGVLGIENEGPDRHIIYENAMNLLAGGHSSEIFDYSGRGCVHDFLEKKK